MNTYDDPPHDPAYQYLRAGSLIKSDTEFFDAFERKWVLANVTVGLKVDPASVGHYRKTKKK